MDQYRPNELLTVARICSEYGIGKTMLYELFKRGDLPSVVIGKRARRVRREEVDNWVKSLEAR